MIPWTFQKSNECNIIFNFPAIPVVQFHCWYKFIVSMKKCVASDQMASLHITYHICIKTLFNPLLHRLFSDHDIIENIQENLS